MFCTEPERTREYVYDLLVLLGTYMLSGLPSFNKLTACTGVTPHRLIYAGKRKGGSCFAGAYEDSEHGSGNGEIHIILY